MPGFRILIQQERAGRRRFSFLSGVFGATDPAEVQDDLRRVRVLHVVLGLLLKLPRGGKCFGAGRGGASVPADGNYFAGSGVKQRERKRGNPG